MKDFILKYNLVLCVLIISFSGFAQNQEKNSPLIYHLNTEKIHWAKLSTFVQFWGRITENNPGTLVNDKPEDLTKDLSIRRFRLAFQLKPSDKLFAFIQLGVNNLNYLSPRGTSIDLLDVYAEYNFSREFSVGVGKSAWDGLSRYTSPNSSKQMTYDLPFVALPTLNETDDLTRKLSIYVKGKINKFDYRFVVAKPFTAQNSRSFDPNPTEGIARITDNKPNLKYAGYLKYEFFDQESNRTFSHVGSYLSSKKVFNLGVGFNLQQDALWSLDQGNVSYHNMLLFATDLFIDIPIKVSKKTSFTSYIAYFNYHFGPNYLRQIGANNPANGIDPNLSSFNGRGNTFPRLGTGDTFLTQLGYLFAPMGKSKNHGQLQPYIMFQNSDFERLEDPLFYYDLGINWYLNGHLSKFSFNAQNRPIFLDTTNELEVNKRKWMLVLQYQFKLQ